MARASASRGFRARRDRCAPIWAIRRRSTAASFYSIDSVIHDYGDICQAVTELADERGVAIEVREFRTLNRCLDNAIAEAVKEFAYGQKIATDAATLRAQERHGSFVHELRNHVGTAMLAFSLVRDGRVTPNGSTGAIVSRSLSSLADLIERGISEVRSDVVRVPTVELMSLSRFITETHDAAILQAQAHGCRLATPEIDPTLAVEADPVLLSGALLNLLGNAFKFTAPGTVVRLEAYGAGDRVLISVSDECGGIPADAVASLFRPFVQRDANRTGLGLGLSFCRKYVESCRGTLTCSNLPGVGCVFTIDLPRHSLEPVPEQALGLEPSIAGIRGLAT